MRSNYLRKIPQPLLDDLVSGRWLPIVGAGMSRNAVLGSEKTMPLWSELGEKLAKEIPNFEYESPIDAISTFDHEFSRPKLVEKLSDLLHVYEAAPGSAHRAFCDVPFDIVCTTNFDFLLERQYELTPRPCTALVEEDQLSVNLQGMNVALLKLHGDLSRPKRLVATEEDYDAFLERFPVLATYLANLLITRTPVLIGYSMGDPDFRQLWQIVGDRLGEARRQAYAMCVGASATEIARFNRRGVNVINLAENRKKCGQVLSDTFVELKKFWQEEYVTGSQIKEEDLLREFSLPVETATRLCFFAIPLSLHPFYREYVFPVVREVGLVPVTPDHIISPGGNVFATIDALLTRASVIVVDSSSEFIVNEARRAIVSEKPVGLIVVAQEGDSTSFGFESISMKIVHRPDLTSVDVEGFLDDFRNLLSDVSEELEPNLANERHRLLQAKEYRAAVISAITHLETMLRRRLDFAEVRDSRYISVTRMINIAKRHKLLGEFAVDQVLRWIELRNQVVHSDIPVTPATAKRIVHGVDHITSELHQ